MKYIALMWLVAFNVATPAQGGEGSLNLVPKKNLTELQDEKGQVRFWVDEWQRTHSPDLIERQQRYNKIIRSYFSSFIGGGLSAPAVSMDCRRR